MGHVVSTQVVKSCRKIHGHNGSPTGQQTCLIVDTQAARGDATGAQNRAVRDAFGIADAVGAGADVLVAPDHRGGRLLH